MSFSLTTLAFLAMLLGLYSWLDARYRCDASAEGRAYHLLAASRRQARRTARRAWEARHPGLTSLKVWGVLLASFGGVCGVALALG